MHRTSAALALILIPAATFAAPLSSIIDDSFAMNELWDDGRAEVASYDSSRELEGAARRFKSHLITVKEDFTKEYYAKANWPYGQKPIVTVIKQNYAATILTENYPFHFLTSTFVERDNFDNAIRLTASSQEWCGSVTKTFELWREPAREVFTSYWDGEGTGERTVPVSPDAYFEEELFVVLRALRFEAGATADCQVFQSQTTNRASEPHAAAAALRIGEVERGWDVNIEVADGRTLHYIFRREYPHALAFFEHSDGRTMELEGLERKVYWER